VAKVAAAGGALVAAAYPAAAGGGVASLNPVADAFVASSQPANNYGGGGALAIAAPGLANGEFQSLLRFDTAGAASAFDVQFGAGQWSIQSVTLRLTATSANSPLFNAPAAGLFAASWMADDSWVEGSGTTGSPGATGITFATLPGFLGAADESLGSFAFSGATSGSAIYSLALTAGFAADLAAGGLVSIRLLAADTAVSGVFNSRTFTTASARPELTITAVPAPAGALAIGVGTLLLALPRRRRRPPVAGGTRGC
jgi:hypothetical protein